MLFLLKHVRKIYNRHEVNMVLIQLAFSVPRHVRNVRVHSQITKNKNAHPAESYKRVSCQPCVAEQGLLLYDLLSNKIKDIFT